MTTTTAAAYYQSLELKYERLSCMASDERAHLQALREAERVEAIRRRNAVGDLFD